MKKTITIIRHAQSNYNAGLIKNETIGIVDCRLSELGKTQAKCLNQTFDVIVLSPLKRAIETYTNSRIKAKNVIISPLFVEQMKIKTVDQNQRILESPIDMRKRAREAIELIKDLDYVNIGIISHCWFIWYFLEECGQNPIKTQNTQSITFEFEL